MVSLCIQIAIVKMQLCSLSVAYACPYHNPVATMGHINKPAVCPVQLKLGFIHEEHFSSIPVAIEGEHSPSEASYNAKLHSGQDPGEDD